MGIGPGHSHRQVLKLNICGLMQMGIGPGHSHRQVLELNICGLMQMGIGPGHSHRQVLKLNVFKSFISVVYAQILPYGVHLDPSCPYAESVKTTQYSEGSQEMNHQECRTPTFFNIVVFYRICCPRFASFAFFFSSFLWLP